LTEFDFRAEFASSVDLSAPEHRALFEQACALLDEIDGMRETIEREGRTLPGQRGVPVAHPLIREVRAHVASFAKLVELLSPDEGPRAGQASAAGTALARARHQRTRS